MAIKRHTSKPAKRKGAAAPAAKDPALNLIRELFADSAEPSFAVVVQVGRAKKRFACEAKSERGARQKALKYYKGMFPEKECKVLSAGPL